MEKVIVFWFRRDLRLFDNRGLFEALSSGFPVLPIFIFDPEILNKLDSRDDARVTFIHHELEHLKCELEKYGSSLKVFIDEPLQVFRTLMAEYDLSEVYANRDYEPYGRQRDRQVELLLNSYGVGFVLFKDHLIFEGEEVLKPDGTPYSVYTPYSRRWKEAFFKQTVESYHSEKLLDRTMKISPAQFPGIDRLGFQRNYMQIDPPRIIPEIIKKYSETRDYPALSGTTRLGIHLRFGTVSIRELTRNAADWSEIFLNELIWRNFFSMVLWHYPDVVSDSFKPRYRRVEWRNDEEEFKRWCTGETGFPIVDAGMRELAATGFMHNRIRMITASFLTKILLIDWRWGEAWFAARLLDYELASNNGNWQWAAGTGCDAAPYFRIFNPGNQAKKYDPLGLYVNKWVPEAGSKRYPGPIADYRLARQRALDRYRKALD